MRHAGRRPPRSRRCAARLHAAAPMSALRRGRLVRAPYRGGSPAPPERRSRRRAGSRVARARAHRSPHDREGGAGGARGHDAGADSPRIVPSRVRGGALERVAAAAVADPRLPPGSRRFNPSPIRSAHVACRELDAPDPAHPLVPHGVAAPPRSRRPAAPGAGAAVQRARRPQAPFRGSNRASAGISRPCRHCRSRPGIAARRSACAGSRAEGIATAQGPPPHVRAPLDRVLAPAGASTPAPVSRQRPRHPCCRANSPRRLRSSPRRRHHPCCCATLRPTPAVSTHGAAGAAAQSVCTAPVARRRPSRPSAADVFRAPVPPSRRRRSRRRDDTGPS